MTFLRHNFQYALLFLWSFVIVFLPHQSLIAGPRIYLPTVQRDNRHCDDGVSMSPFGVQLYWNRNEKSQATYDYLWRSEARWIRIQVRWYWVEGDSERWPEYRWGTADRFVEARAQYCRDIVLNLVENPLWTGARHRRSEIPPDLYDDFGRFVAAVVERYDGDGYRDAPGSPVVRDIELYNEPDDGTDGWGNHGKEYADMLRVVYPLVKAASPDAKLTLGGIALDWYVEDGGPFVRSFLDDVLAAGGGAYFDVMNWHLYPAHSWRWADQGPGIYEKAQAVREMMAKHGVSKPQIVTEAGWFSNDGPFTTEGSVLYQASYVVEFFTQAIAADIDVLIWWMLHDPGGFHKTGLITGSPADPDTPVVAKPAFYAFQVAAGKLGHVEAQHVFAAGTLPVPNMQAYQFRDRLRRQILYVAWLTPVDTEDVTTWRVRGSRAVVMDIYGKARTVMGRDGWIEIEVTGTPIYVSVPDRFVLGPAEPAKGAALWN